jgi:hypothetical protein
MPLKHSKTTVESASGS